MGAFRWRHLKRKNLMDNPGRTIGDIARSIGILDGTMGNLNKVFC